MIKLDFALRSDQGARTIRSLRSGLKHLKQRIGNASYLRRVSAELPPVLFGGAAVPVARLLNRADDQLAWGQALKLNVA